MTAATPTPATATTATPATATTATATAATATVVVVVTTATHHHGSNNNSNSNSNNTGTREQPQPHHAHSRRSRFPTAAPATTARPPPPSRPCCPTRPPPPRTHSQRPRPAAPAPSRRREFCHSAAPPSTVSRCLNSDGERESVGRVAVSSTAAPAPRGPSTAASPRQSTRAAQGPPTPPCRPAGSPAAAQPRRTAGRAIRCDQGHLMLRERTASQSEVIGAILSGYSPRCAVPHLQGLQPHQLGPLHLWPAARVLSSCCTPSACSRCFNMDGEGVSSKAPSNWRDCHFADAPSPSVLRHRLNVEGGSAE